MYWIDCKQSDSGFLCFEALKSIISHTKKLYTSIVFICIGTPLIDGDALGPLTGTLLSQHIPYSIYGTLDTPIHALNLHKMYKEIKKKHPQPFIVAIDASLGLPEQTGYIFIKKGPLHPGKGLGKKLPPIGHMYITGVFEDLFAENAYDDTLMYAQCIVDGILKFHTSFQGA